MPLTSGLLSGPTALQAVVIDELVHDYQLHYLGNNDIPLNVEEIVEHGHLQDFLKLIGVGL